MRYLTNDTFLRTFCGLWNQKKSGQIREDEMMKEMVILCDDFDERFGEGSASALLDLRKYDSDAIIRQIAMEELGPESGDFAGWLNDTDAAFLKNMGIKQ